jgi:uncharacterized membrane protein
MANANNQLTISNSLSQGWQYTKKNYSVLVLCFLVLAGISTAFSIFRSIPNTIVYFTGDSSSAGLAVLIIFALLSPLLFVAETALQNLTAIGFTKIQLNILDSKKTKVSDLFNANGIFWQYLATSILVGLIVIGGLLLLIVPGIIWLLKYQFAMPLIVDKKLDITESIRKSGEITKGHKGWLFGFAIVLGLVNIGGALLLLVGLLVTIPLTTMAYIYVYRQLSSGVKANKN